MKKCFIAYFDFLGYKQFINNNSNEDIEHGVNNILIDIEFATARNQIQPTKHGLVFADLNNHKINCLNVSDTVVFWTNDCDLASFHELLEVAYNFNIKEICYNFPTRGAIICGEIGYRFGSDKNQVGGALDIRCLYGKGIVNAHYLAENQSWAGCVIDQSCSKEFSDNSDFNDLILKYSKKYNVPFKSPPNYIQEYYVLNLVEGSLDEVSYQNRKSSILSSFSKYNKKIENVRVKKIIDNTIKFLDIYKEIV